MRTSLYQLKWGVFNLINGDMISEYAKTYGEWSEVEVYFFHSILNEQSNVIEVGSNIGMHAVPLAKKIPHGKLFCFEPQRIIFQNLCCNLALNNLTNVYAYNQGVGSQPYEMEIASSDYNATWNYGSYSLEKGFNAEGDFQGEIHSEHINIISLDTHPEIQKLPSLKLLKIDAEGFELNVLQGATQIIQKYQPVIFVEAFPTQPLTLDIIQYLNHLNYDCYWFLSERFQSQNYFQQPKSITGIDYNLACLHRSQPIRMPTQLLAQRDVLPTTLPIVTAPN